MTNWTKAYAYGPDAAARQLQALEVKALSIWYDLYRLTDDVAMGTVADSWDLPAAWDVAEALIEEMRDRSKQRKAQGLLHQVRQLYGEYSRLRGVFE
jgi:hypothetical protein